MKLSEILEEQCIVPNLKGLNKVDAIHELIESLHVMGKIQNKAEIIKALLEREELGSTGIGDNIAIPHAKTKESNSLIIMYARSKNGLDFDSLDRKPVHHIFLLIAPQNSTGIHLKALARISRLLKNSLFRKKLLKAGNQKNLYEVILSEDSQYN